MKRNVLLLLGSFTALLWSCGSQSLRTSIADDGLYFDPKIEERLNQAKAAERAAKAEELKSATEAALAQKNQAIEQSGNTSEVIQQGGGILYQIQDNKMSTETSNSAADLSGTSSTREESQYARSFIFDDPTVVVLYRDPWFSPWYAYGPSWSIGWNWSTRWGFRPYWNAGIYWGWNSWYDPFWSGWYDPWYGYGYGGWYGYPHYGHGHYPVYAGRPYSNTKRNRVGGSNNSGFGSGSYMGVDSYSSGYRRPGSTTGTTQAGNTARPNTSTVNPGGSGSATPVNPNNYRRPAGTGSNNTTVNNTDVTKNETGTNYRRPMNSGSGAQRPMTVPVGNDNNSGSNSGYRRPAGTNNGSSNKGTSPTQVYTRPSVSHDAYNNTSRGSSPASENLRRRSSEQNDGNSTRTETNSQNRRNREYNNNEYNTSPKNAYPNNGGSNRNTAPSSGGNNQSNPSSGGNRRR